MSATYPMDMVRGRITVQVHFSFYQMIAFVVVDIMVVVILIGENICLWS